MDYTTLGERSSQNLLSIELPRPTLDRGKSVLKALQLIYIVDVNKLSNTSGYQEPGLQDPEIQKSYYYDASSHLLLCLVLFV